MVDRPIMLVCGLGRCGTSLIMQMLAAGGAKVAGSYPDFECQETYPSMSWSWLTQQGGKAVKVLDPHVSMQRPSAPVSIPGGFFSIWLRRDPRQQAKSQIKLLRAMGHNVPDTRNTRRLMVAKLKADEPRALNAIPVPLLTLDFEDVIRQPHMIAETMAVRLRPWWDGLDAGLMAAQARPRSPDCLHGMLETHLMEAPDAR
jgi:hypothetical protein